MKTFALQTSTAARLQARTPRFARSRTGLRVSANTIWQLVPDSKWCNQHKDECAVLETIDLTRAVGRKKFCTVGTAADHQFDSDEVIHTNHEGVHVVFEAEGASNPLDSPSVLYVQDLDSKEGVWINGSRLPRAERIPVKPGSIIAFGEYAVYEVHRNVLAHA